jgi:hypothetical protein
VVPMTRWLPATGVALVLTGNAGTSVAQERGGQGAGHFSSTLTFDPRPESLPFPILWRWDVVIPFRLSPSIALPPLPENAPIGGLQLDVQPWRAEVYVDGAYAGLVRDFTGYYHHLDLVAGSHLIAIVTPDYQPLIVDVVVSPGHTTTYRGALTRTPAR